jgi:hypothetical protein
MNKGSQITFDLIRSFWLIMLFDVSRSKAFFFRKIQFQDVFYTTQEQ